MVGNCLLIPRPEKNEKSTLLRRIVIDFYNLKKSTIVNRSQRVIAFHSNLKPILAWRIPWARGAWWATWGCKKLDMTK